MSVADPAPVRGPARARGREDGGASAMVLRIAWLLTTLLQVFVVITFAILTLGFVLLLFGANPDAPFAEWVYRALERVMAPFPRLFETVRVNGESVLDPSVLFAMVVYGMAGLGLGALIDRLARAAPRR